MFELSLNIMDIAQNSIRADAKNVAIRIGVDAREDMMRIEIEDDGSGMGSEALQAAADPFYTTRTTRKVGLGLPYFAMVAGMCDGGLDISSEPGEGTCVTATMRLSHIDRAPLGDMGQTVALLAGANPGVDFVYELSVMEASVGEGESGFRERGAQKPGSSERDAQENGSRERGSQERKFRFDSREVKAILDGVGIGTPEVVVYMEGYINESMQTLTGGIEL